MQHSLFLPAPWGVGVVLGLKRRAYSPDPLPLGRVSVEQVRASGDFRGALNDLMAQASRHRIAPAKLAPWAAFYTAGVVGSITVTASQPLLGNRGYVLSLADPLPAWRMEAAAA